MKRNIPKWYGYYKALELALSIWQIYEMPRAWEPFDSISWSTAWAVSRDIWVKP